MSSEVTHAVQRGGKEPQIWNRHQATKSRNGQGAPECVQIVEHLLAEYLHGWGLQNALTIAVHCRRWCEQTRPPEGELDVTKWTQAALQQAARDIDRWLDHLTRSVAPAGANIAAHKGLVALAAPSALEQYPEAFLNFDWMPDALLQKLRAQAGAPVVPPCAGRNLMGGPPLEELLPELKSSRSQRIYEAIVRLMQGN